MARGVKTCPECHLDQGPRTLVCKCGHDFDCKKIFEVKNVNINVNKPVPLTVDQVQPYHKGITLIFVPGSTKKDQPFCPYPLPNTEEKTVLNWLDKIKNYKMIYCGRDTRYAKSAIRYFVFGLVKTHIKDEEGEIIVNPEFTKVINIIDKNMLPYPQEIAEGWTDTP